MASVKQKKAGSGQKTTSPKVSATKARSGSLPKPSQAAKAVDKVAGDGETKPKSGRASPKAPEKSSAKKQDAVTRSPNRSAATTKMLAVATGNWAAFLKNGGVDPLKISRDLGITKSDLAETLGLPADALVRDERILADKTQARLCELLEILTRVEPWSGGLRPAFAWYRSQGIPALGDATAESMVKTNRAGLVRTYLEGIAAGGFA